MTDIRRVGKALAMVTGLALAMASGAQAQQFAVGGGGFGASGIGFGTGVGYGNGFGYGSGYNGFGYGGYNGYGYGGYNNYPGYGRFGAQPYTGPMTYNNMGGLMNSIQSQTGRHNSYRPGGYQYYGVNNRRIR